MCSTRTRAEEDQAGQGERRRHLDELRAEQHVPAVVAIGDDAADQREQHDRQLAEEIVEPEVERRVGQLEDQPGLRDLLHPVADGRGEGAEPQDAEVAVVEGGKGAADERKLRGADALQRHIYNLRARLIRVRGRAYTRAAKAKKKRNARRASNPCCVPASSMSR